MGLKASNGFTKFWPSVGTVVAMAISLTLLGFSLRTLPLGTAYAIWTGIGAAGTVAVGIWAYGEPAGIARLACVFLIVSGIVGLKLTTKPDAPKTVAVNPE